MTCRIDHDLAARVLRDIADPSQIEAAISEIHPHLDEEDLESLAEDIGDLIRCGRITITRQEAP